MQSETHVHRHEIKHQEQTTCCIVGGGPAGAILALLLARKGIPTVLLEAHMDFDREFRGDTIHPSVLNILDEIGIAERLLQIRHTKMSTLTVQTPAGNFPIANFKGLKTKYPYIAILPQVEFLQFIIEEAKHYPSFQLVMGAQVDELIEEDGKICGVRYRGQDGWYEVQAMLTIGADGRFSRVRKLAGFTPVTTSPPMDVLWFRLSRKPSDSEETFGRFAKNTILALINRIDYWQVGYVIPKGTYQQIRAAGLDHLHETIIDVVPELADRVGELREWKQISVLSVESNRLPCWYRPGLLLIGDAAHVMSPVGGVGINYAIQDAVVTANVLSAKLKYGIVSTHDLAEVQHQREIATRLIQMFQSFMQQRVLANALSSGPNKPFTLPPIVRFLWRIPWVRSFPARLVAFGFRPAHVKN